MIVSIVSTDFAVGGVTVVVRDDDNDNDPTANADADDGLFFELCESEDDEFNC